MADDTLLDPVLDEIETFIRSAGMTPTDFGRRALNDPALVHQLRRGREVKRSTRMRILGFIESSQRPAPAATEAA